MGRARCESCKSIDVRRWQRQGLLSPGTFFSQTWTCDGESSGSVSVVVRDGSVTLGYRLGQNGQPIEQPLYFAWTRTAARPRLACIAQAGSAGAVPCPLAVLAQWPDRTRRLIAASGISRCYRRAGARSRQWPAGRM
jgi:hypothetical protein